MPYSPEFKGPIEGYVVNHLHRNHWRVVRTHDWEDAMQEAYAVFLRCSARYEVEGPAHFMALFKTAWANEFNDLSTSSTASRADSLDASVQDDDAPGSIDYLVGELDNDGHLGVLIRQAPAEVVMVLNLFLSAPQELLDLALSTWRKNGRYRADGDKAVAKMLGLPKESKPMTATFEYFTK